MRQTVRRVARYVLACIVSVSVCMTASVAVTSYTFGGLDLNGNDDLLFTLSGEYKTLFLAHLTDTGVDSGFKLLSCYPEQITPIQFSNSLLIRNRYGIALYSNDSEDLKWISSENDLRTIKISPDGKWLCCIIRNVSGTGSLVLMNTQTGAKKVLAERISADTDRVNVKWSPDSSFVVYEKGGGIYFLNPDIAFKDIALDEEYRKIGRGTVRNVEWTQNKSLLYIDGDIIYRMQESELYIRGLYASYVGGRSVLGRLLYAFDSAQDCFWCNSDGSQLVINTGNKFVTYCTVNEEKYDFVQPVVQQPLSIVPGAPLDCNVFWQKDSSHNDFAPVLWIDYIRYSDEKCMSAVYSLSDKVHLISTAGNSIEPVLSPDGKYVAFCDDSDFLIYSLEGWKEVLCISGQETVSAAWRGTSGIYVGGKETVRYLEFTEQDYKVTKHSSVLFLSSVWKSFWNEGKIVAYTSEKSPAFLYDSDRNVWSVIDSSLEKNPRAAMLQTNDNFRVFIGQSDNSSFTNSVFVRTLDKKAFTYPLDGRTQKIVLEKKKAALIFDAAGDAKGIGRILYTLRKYEVFGTFFINGEFIQRYPLETKLLSDSGNVCASMFFCNVDLLDSSYKIDTDFIRQGLARNEDDFYMVTGKELSLLWHAPFNRYNSWIKAAGTESGYSYVDAGNIEEDCLVVPLSVGTADRELEAVIVSLLNDGYEFVSVLDLVEKSSCKSDCESE